MNKIQNILLLLFCLAFIFFLLAFNFIKYADAPVIPVPDRITSTQAAFESRNIDITLVVGSKTYKLTVPEGSTIFEAMESAAKNSGLTFVSEFYPDLGFFIREMDGVPNADGFYWTLYVNGTFASVGASNYILKPGDRVDWKYENK